MLRIATLSLAAATLAASALPPAASAQPYGGDYGYRNGAYGNGFGRPGRGGFGRDRALGVVVRVNGTDLTLANGRHVYMHDGTVINPTGATIRDGQRIEAHGVVAENGNLRANVVNIAARAFGGYRDGYDGYGRRQGGY